MAFYDQNEDEEELINQPQAPTTGPSSSVINPGQQMQNASNQKPDKPGNFMALQQYIEANQSQAGKLGDQTASVITNSAQGARDSVSGLQNKFNQAAGSAPTVDDDTYSTLSSGAEKLSNDQKAKVKTAYNAAYTGPNALTDLGQDYTKTQQAVTKAKTNIDSSGTEQGRQSLIAQVNTKPRNQGITTFDSMLLSSGGGRQKLADAAKSSADVSETLLSGANAQANQKAQEIKTATNAERAKAQQAVGSATTNLGKGIDQKLQDAIAKALGANKRVVNDINDHSLEDETLQMLKDSGLKSGTDLYDTSLSTYLTQADPTKINRSNVSSLEDFARAAALAELSGEAPALSAAEASLAGTAVTDPRFNNDALKSDLTKKDQNFEKAWKSGKNWLTADKYDSQFGSLVDPDHFDEVDDIMNLWTGRSLSNASPADVEKTIIPNLKNVGTKTALHFANRLQEQLEAFKTKNHVNNRVTAAQRQSGRGI